MRRMLLLIITLALVSPLGAKDKEAEKAEKAARKAEKLAAKNSGSPSPASGSSSGAAPTESGAPATGFDAFRNVKLKNIFDPTRRGIRAESTAASAETVKRGRSLALTGTMVTEGRELAFFSGSAAEGSRVVPTGNKVAGYAVTAIGPTQVTLERDGHQTLLAVGRQLTFEADGPAGAAEPVIEKAPDHSPEATGIPALPGISADKAEILRKMMERRAKEVGR